MMKNLFVALAATAVAVGGMANARAEQLYGLTNLQQLVTFDSATRVVTASTSLSGFGISGPFLVSIDVRPATGELYGLSNQNHIYKINPLTGTSTMVTMSPLVLTGNAKAIDFNPTVDRIRVLSSGDNNLRVHPDTGAVAFTDANLAFAAGDANAGDNPAVVNGAYTNSFAGATTTTLYNLEAGNDVLVTQVPPNDGVLNTVGPLGLDVVDSGGFTGFDISGVTGIAYLTGNRLGGATPAAGSLYTVDLATGATTLLGAVTNASGGSVGTFRDIAVAAAVIPEPTTVGMMLVASVAMLSLRRRVQ